MHALIAATIISVGYIFVYYDYIIDRIIYVDDMTLTDKVLSVALMLLVLEGTPARAGPGAADHGHRVPRSTPTSSPGSSRSAVIDQLYLSTEGIFGQPLAVSASYVMIFVLFGAFMERTGTGQLFMDFAMGITGHTAGGPGKVSVVSSSLFGTISGSRRRQRHGRRADHHSADEAHGLQGRTSPPPSRRPHRPAARSCRRSWARRPS